MEQGEERMMEYRNTLLHNVAELTEMPDGSVRPQRVPESVRAKLENPGVMLGPANVEIRFVLNGDVARITLSADEPSKVFVYWGLYQVEGCHEIGPEPTTIEVQHHEGFVPAKKYLEQEVFSHDVCRVSFATGPVYIHDIAGDIRPPASDELPSLRHMAYGTSITHAGNRMPHLKYSAITARRLGADLINLGMSGACMCESVMGDYIASRADWDFATLALSVNMVKFYSLDEFSERVGYVVDKIAGSNASRLVACVTLWPYRQDLANDLFEGAKGKSEEFRERLRAVVRESPHANLRLIEGPEMLTDWTGHTADLLHPGDLGMVEMGMNLSARMKQLLDEFTS